MPAIHIFVCDDDICGGGRAGAVRIQWGEPSGMLLSALNFGNKLTLMTSAVNEKWNAGTPKAQPTLCRFRTRRRGEHGLPRAAGADYGSVEWKSGGENVATDRHATPGADQSG